jgi:hypothetical protein
VALLTLFASLAISGSVRAEDLLSPETPPVPLTAPQPPKPPAPLLVRAPAPNPPWFSWGSGAVFLAGAGTAFVAHETCHLATNYGTGNAPGFEPVTFLGFIPFVAIVPSITCRNGECRKHNGEPYYAGRPGLYTIVSAGLQCQHYEDEIILTARPDLRMIDAPFRKGMLTFNTLLSLGYVLSNLAGVEPTDGDLRGMKRDGGAPRALAVSLVFSIAALDIARYYFPQSRWLTWLSRAAKMSVTGTAFAM